MSEPEMFTVAPGGSEAAFCAFTLHFQTERGVGAPTPRSPRVAPSAPPLGSGRFSAEPDGEPCADPLLCLLVLLIASVIGWGAVAFVIWCVCAAAASWAWSP